MKAYPAVHCDTDGFGGDFPVLQGLASNISGSPSSSRKLTAEETAEIAYRQMREFVPYVRDFPALVEPKEYNPRPYQTEKTEKAKILFMDKRIVICEIGCGLGKTYISAMVAEEYLDAGKKVVFVSPSRTAMGDRLHGNVSTFHSLFAGKGKEVGLVNGEDFWRNDVFFFTAAGLIKLSRETENGFFESFMSEVGLIIVDEIHRFPDDTSEEERTAVIGKVRDLIADHCCARAKVFGMTATHTRMDGLLPLGEKEPDIRYTIAESIMEGFAPDIHGLPVLIDVDVDRVQADKEGNLKLFMKSRELAKYERSIVENVHRLAGDYPGKAHCFFVRTIEDAYRLRKKLNKKFGGAVFGCLLSKNEDGSPSTMEDRQEVIKAVQNGELLGYITVNIGAESVDVERLMFCHIIVRTKSDVRLAQMVGRITRQWPGKDRVVIVDYMVAREKIIRCCLGLWDYARMAGSKKTPQISRIGGSLFTHSDSDRDASGCEGLLTYGEIDAWISSQCGGSGWDAAFALLVEHKEKNGSCIMSQDYEANGIGLGAWVHRQQAKLRQGKLPAAKADKLNCVGLAPEPLTEAWIRGFLQFACYRKSHGEDSRVSMSYKTDDGFPLGEWVLKQRYLHKNGKLPAHLVAMLDEAGFPWDIFRE